MRTEPPPPCATQTHPPPLHPAAACVQSCCSSTTRTVLPPSQTAPATTAACCTHLLRPVLLLQHNILVLHLAPSGQLYLQRLEVPLTEQHKKPPSVPEPSQHMAAGLACPLPAAALSATHCWCLESTPAAQSRPQGETGAPAPPTRLSCRHRHGSRPPATPPNTAAAAAAVAPTSTAQMSPGFQDMGTLAMERKDQPRGMALPPTHSICRLCTRNSTASRTLQQQQQHQDGQRRQRPQRLHEQPQWPAPSMAVHSTAGSSRPRRLWPQPAPARMPPVTVQRAATPNQRAYGGAACTHLTSGGVRFVSTSSRTGN